MWAPDIVWEKDDSESDKDEAPQRGDDGGAKFKPQPKPKATDLSAGTVDAAGEGAQESTVQAAQGDSDASAVTTRSADADDEADAGVPAEQPPRRRGKERRKSKRYYSKDECAICMDNFHKGEIVRILPCGHVFHKDECDEWLLKWRKLVRSCVCGSWKVRWKSLSSTSRKFSLDLFTPRQLCRFCGRNLFRRNRADVAVPDMPCRRHDPKYGSLVEYNDHARRGPDGSARGRGSSWVWRDGRRGRARGALGGPAPTRPHAPDLDMGLAAECSRAPRGRGRQRR